MFGGRGASLKWIGHRSIPERKATEHAPVDAVNGLRAGRCAAQVVVRLVENCAADSRHLDLLDREFQALLGWNAQQDQMTWLFRLLKSAAGFQADMAHLDDLIGKRNIRANQDVGIVRGCLLLRHGRIPCSTQRQALRQAQRMLQKAKRP
jgi:hypothetical protein